MRLPFIFTFLLISFFSFGQTASPIVQGSKLYKFKNGVALDSVIFLPRRDTFNYDLTMKAPGMVIWRPADSIIYGFTGNKWKAMFPAAQSVADIIGLQDSLKAIKDTSNFRYIKYADNMSVLRSMAGPKIQMVYLKGFNSPGDGGGGMFYWDNTSTATDNLGTVIKNAAVTTGRWIRANVNNKLNVRWFGAVGDGIVNDAPAIQATIDAGIAGSIIYIPPVDYSGGKFYSLSATLNVNKAFMKIQAAGDVEPGVSVLKNAVANDTILVIRNSSVGVEGIWFIGDGGLLLSPVPTTNGVCIIGDSNGNADAFFTRCTFIFINKCIIAKSRNVNVFDNLFSNSRYGLSAESIAIPGEMRGFIVTHNRFHTVGKFQLTDAAVVSSDTSNFSFKISDNYLDGQSNAYLALLKASKYVDIENNTVVDNRTGFVSIDTCTNFKVSNNTFYGGSLAPAAVPAIYLNGCSYGQVNSNNISHSQNEGIKLDLGGSIGIKIADNKISDWSFSATGFYAINMTSAVTRSDVTNNSLSIISSGLTPGGSVLNNNNLNNVFNNTYYPFTSLGRPAYTEVNGNIMLTNISTVNAYILRTGQASGVNKLTMQAGEGSDVWGGAISVYGAAHATFPGQVRVGLSSLGTSKFEVNTAGLGESGTNLFTVLAGGNVGIANAAPNSTLAITGTLSRSVRTVTGATTLGNDYFLNVNNSSNIVISLPAASTITGREYVVTKISNNGNTVTITPAAGTIGPAATLVLSSWMSFATVWTDGTNWFIR